LIHRVKSAGEITGEEPDHQANDTAKEDGHKLMGVESKVAMRHHRD
jgi:hypothetical protein